MPYHACRWHHCSSLRRSGWRRLLTRLLRWPIRRKLNYQSLKHWRAEISRPFSWNPLEFTTIGPLPLWLISIAHSLNAEKNSLLWICGFCLILDKVTMECHLSLHARSCSFGIALKAVLNSLSPFNSYIVGRCDSQPIKWLFRPSFFLSSAVFTKASTSDSLLLSWFDVYLSINRHWSSLNSEQGTFCPIFSKVLVNWFGPKTTSSSAITNVLASGR